MARWLFCIILLICSVFADAVTFSLDDAKSIQNAAALMAHGVQQLYTGNQTGGVLGKFPFPPYYWWESGGAWGSMLQYQIYTGDMSYNNVLYEAVVSQLGREYDFIMEAEVADTGNDDQAFWIFVAMTAAEYNYPAPPTPAPSWLGVVQNAFEEYVQRWNTTYCNGGLKWQFNPNNNGFHYKQSISNGAFFQIAARLARFTGNQTYADWAEKVWDWTRAIGLMDDAYNVYDGSDELINCTGIDHHQWSYNAGVFLYGAAVMQNFTRSATWAQRTSGLLDSTSKFFSPFPNSTDIMFERECEATDPMACNTDQQSMKAYLTRWLAGTSMMAPFTAGQIGTWLQASARGAAAACSGGPSGSMCGMRWYIDGFDNTTGLGPSMAALEAFTALLVNQTAPPGTMLQAGNTTQPLPLSTIITIPSTPSSTSSPTTAAWNTITGGWNRWTVTVTTTTSICTTTSYKKP